MIYYRYKMRFYWSLPLLSDALLYPPIAGTYHASVRWKKLTHLHPGHRDVLTVSIYLITRCFFFELEGSVSFLDEPRRVSKVNLFSDVFFPLSDAELFSLVVDDKSVASLHGRPSSSLWQVASIATSPSKSCLSSHSFKTVGILLHPLTRGAFSDYW